MAQSKSRKLVTGTISAAVIASALAPVAASASTAHITTVYGPSTKTVYQGQSVSLPSTVMVKYSNGKKASVKVKWGKVPTSVGSHKVSGQVAGTTKTASITVVVKADSAKTVSYGNVVNVKAGLVPSPQKVTVTYYSGRTTTTTINLSNVNTSKVGSQMVKTTVAGKTVTVTVNVKAPSVKSATALNGKQIKVVFETGKTVTVDLPYTFKDGSTSSSFWYYGYNYKAISLTTPYVAPTTVSSVSAINGATSSNLSLAAGNNTVTLQANDAKGNAITSGITWSSSDDSVATVTSSGKVVAENTGSVTITATDAQGNKATYKVTVAGQAAGVTLSAASANVVANGISTDVITANVVDANGNKVSNFNGMLQVEYKTTEGATHFTDANGDDLSTSLQTVQVTNGVATIPVLAQKAAGLTDTLTVGTLTDVNGNTVSNLNAGTVNVTSVAQVATSIKVSANSSTLSANSANNPDDITAEVLDQTGNPMVDGKAYSLNFNLSGTAATWADGTTADKSGAFLANVNPTNAKQTIASQNGVTGATTVTVSGAGLTSGSVTVNSVTTQNASKLSLSDVTDTSPAFTENGTSTATLTVNAQDPNGNPVALPTGHDYYVYVTNSNGTPATNIEVNGTPIPSTGKGVSIGTGTASTFTLTDVTGKANAGQYNVVVEDLATSGALTASPAFAVNENANSASAITLTASNDYLTTASPSATFTVQTTDVNGNPVAKSGVPVTFAASTTSSTTAESSFAGGTLSTTPSYTAYTDANGKATVSFNSQAYNNVKWNVTATPTSGYGISGAQTASTTVEYSVTNALNLALGSIYNAGTVSGSIVGSGSNIYGTITEQDQYGNAISTSNENDNVTLTFSPATGVTLNNVATSGLTETTTASSVSLTGTVSALNTYLASGNVVAAGTGTVSATVKDNSVSASAGNSAVSVNAGVAATVTAVNSNGATTGQSVSSQSIVGPYTIEVQDAAGNVVNAPGTVALSLGNLQEIFGTNLQGVRTSSTGTETTTISIPAGQSSVQVYLDTTGNVGTDPSLDLGADTLTYNSTTSTWSAN